MQHAELAVECPADWLSFADAKALNTPINGPLGRVPQRCQVAIVGAGPIGLLAANLLGALSIDVVVIEKNTTTSGLPKAIVMDDEHYRAIDRLGVSGAVSEHARPFGIHFFAAGGRPLVQANGFITPNGRGNRNAISQPVYEKVLLASLEKRSTASICYGTELTGFVQDQDGVHLRVRTEDGAVTTIQADYMLACDGANSSVRKDLGIAFAGRRIDQPHLVVDLAEFPDQAPFSRFYCDPERPFNSVPGPYGGRRIEFMLVPGDDPEELCTPAAVRRIVDKHTPYAGAPLKILRTAVYGFSERVAEDLSQGRVFLLGDAAHVMPPFGAQGLNTGARDAVNLCWKLHGVLTGLWRAEILKSYDIERKPQIEQMIAYSVKVGRLANIQSHVLASLRNLALWVLNRHSGIRSYFSQMRYMPRPTIATGILIPDTNQSESLIGTVFPRIGGLGDSKTENFDQLVGQKFALVGIDVDGAVLKSALELQPWSDLHPSLVLLSEKYLLPPGNDALSARMRQLLSLYRGCVLVIRPDRYIAGAIPPEKMSEASEKLKNLLHV